MKMNPKKDGALGELLTAASHKVLNDLILELAAEWPDVRRECFEFLKSHVSVSKALEKRSEGEIVLALWSELAPDLDELDGYGGGDYTSEDHVGELLDQIRMRLISKKVGPDHRREILDMVLPFIESGNAGLAYNPWRDKSKMRPFSSRRGLHPRIICPWPHAWILPGSTWKLAMPKRPFPGCSGYLQKSVFRSMIGISCCSKFMIG